NNFKDMRGNPVKLILPGAAAPAKKPEPPKEKPEPPKKKLGTISHDEQPVSAQDGKPQLVGPKGKKADDKGKEKELPPVTISAFGNRLVVTSDDPKALQLISELVRLYTRTAEGEGDFKVIKLKNASAIETATILDEWF